jgi:hypothetical protein
MCSVALEHAVALRLLLRAGCPTSGVGLLRLQFEAVTRAMWLHYAASDAAVAKLMLPLGSASEKHAKKLPGATDMLKDLTTRAPPAACQMLSEFKDVSWGAMNSFVHGGIHAVRRHMEGLPAPLITQVIKNSNALLTMVGMTLALLSRDERAISVIAGMQPRFADCLPLLKAE